MDIPWNPAVLEQRIGRVHRLGQQRAVRVVNFVSAASIEERILELLKFKKSLFAGALDADGENVVMVGASQFKRFMQSVETVMADVKKPDPAHEAALQKETEADKKSAEAEAPLDEDQPGLAGPEDGHLAAFNELLISGAKLLTDISKTLSISLSGQATEGLLGVVVSRDEKSGKPCLKIPLPDKDVLENIVSAFGKLLGGLK